jgi:hypothetical protein
MAVTDLGVAGMAALLGIWLVHGNGYWGGGSWGNSRPRYASADQFTEIIITRAVHHQERELQVDMTATALL